MQNKLAHSVYNRSLLLSFLLVFACLSSAIASAIYFYSYQRFHLQQEQLERAESVLLERAARTLQRDLSEVIADIRRISHSQILRDYLKTAGPVEHRRLQKEFVNLARYAGIYDQIRLLSARGREQLRINFNQGTPAPVAARYLQDKSDRYYFRVAIRLPPEQVYISPLDLNMESGMIEYPLKPMIRVVMPLHDAGRLKGVLVLNYLATHMLERFAKRVQRDWGEGMLVNNQGYWLYHRNADKRWGFMLGHGQRFDRDYPLAWRGLSTRQSGRLQTAEGLFFFFTVYPEVLAGNSLPGTEDSSQSWKLISRISPEQLQFSLAKSLQHDRLAYGGLLVLSVLLSYFLAWLRTSNIEKTRALQRSEASLTEAQKIAHMGNWRWDIDSGELSWSDEIYRIFGLRPQQFIPSYDAFLQRIHPDDRSMVTHAVDTALYSDRYYSVEHRILLPDDSIRYVREHGAVLLGDDGKPEHMLGTIQDITETRLAHEELQKKEEQIRSLVEQAPDGIFIADLDGRYSHVNQAGCRMLGYSREEIIGKTILDFIPAEDIPRLEDSRERLLHGNVDVSEWSLRHKDGHYIPVEVSASIVADGRWQGFVRDISERKHAEKKLRQAAAVFDSTSEAILVTDTSGRIIAVNQAYSQITGFSEEEALGKTPRIHHSGRHDDAFYRQLWESLEHTGQWQGEIWNRRKCGEIYPGWENISAVKDAQGKVINYVSVLSDISSIKETEDRLSHLAHHDVLTELPNRMAFLVSLEQALEHAQRHHKKIALLFLDLDRFKLINDTLGHDMGDELLKMVAERIKHNLRGEDMVARLGGDEFTIIMEDIDQAQDAALLAQKMTRAISEPVKLKQHEVSTSTSIGISIYPDDADSVSDLVKAADAAMYRAKNNGRNTYEYYTSELTTLALRRLSLENDLRQALAQDEFILYYQPQIDVASGRIVGVEALIRWQHPQLGMIMPDQFINVAEESGLIDNIGAWVIRQSFAQARIWRDRGLPPLRVAVNMSGHQIIYDHTLETVHRAMQKNGYNPRNALYELEITESVLQSGHNAVRTLKQLRRLGVSIAIDDFGTGYSSLSHLKHLPVDTLKIDRAFLRNMSRDRDNKAIATAIISLGHSLGLKVVAEGVENIAQLKYLRDKGCDEAQGFLISKPVCPDAIEKLLKQGWQLPSGLSSVSSSSRDSN